MKELLSLHNISRYNNTFLVACEATGGDKHLALEGFAWEDKAIDISGFKAYKGIRISIVYQDGEKLDERVDEIIVIGR